MNAVHAVDGTRLHLQHWPAPGSAHGTVQIVHGLGEHIGRYAALAHALQRAGWNVAGHDHRGHGRSEGPRGAVPSASALLQDLATVIDSLRGPGRHVLLGHSMGGLVAARFVAESIAATPAPWWREVDGLVLLRGSFAGDFFSFKNFDADRPAPGALALSHALGQRLDQLIAEDRL